MTQALPPGYTTHDRERWAAEDALRRPLDRDDFARDRARVVHSAALRRLAATTQVLQPTTDDFIRNRLTHSLEVAQIGRELGAALGCSADVVDTACLAHDLGHPPFGHNGERALAGLAADIGGFEGNAQSLRLVTRLEAKRAHPDGRPAGLNLTRASLDALVKYPWGAGAAQELGTPKFNVYEDDLPVFEWLREGGAERRRCFEAQVMDWSDDVAYSVHDLEDGIASGRIDPRALRDDDEVATVAAVARESYAPDLDADALAEAMGRLTASGALPAGHDPTRPGLAALKDMTSRLIGRFVRPVETATREAHGGGPLTRHSADLVVPDTVRAECAVLKAAAAHYVMRTPTRHALLASQREVVAALVEMYSARPDRLDPVFAADLREAELRGDDTAARRVVIDQVATLSDARALTTYTEWCSRL